MAQHPGVPQHIVDEALKHAGGLRHLYTGTDSDFRTDLSSLLFQVLPLEVLIPGQVVPDQVGCQGGACLCKPIPDQREGT